MQITSNHLRGGDECVEGAVGGRLDNEVLVVLELVLLDRLLLLRLEHRLQLLLGRRAPRRPSALHLAAAAVPVSAA